MWIIIFSSRGLLPRLRGKRNNPIQHPHLYEQHNNSCTQTNAHTHTLSKTKCMTKKVSKYFLSTYLNVILGISWNVSRRHCWREQNVSVDACADPQPTGVQAEFLGNPFTPSPSCQYLLSQNTWWQVRYELTLTTTYF